MDIIIKPEEIEKKSMEIITSRIGNIYGDTRDDILKRVIHTTADFDYVQNLVFSPNVAQKATEALKKGAVIVTDTNMAYSGINKRSLEAIGSRACCFMSDADVAKKAKELSVTRAAVAVEKAAQTGEDIIFAIGNAPTALIKIYELVKNKVFVPKLVIGVPVGFVNVVGSKELIMSLDVPYIVAKGNKGGSNVAAAICNSIIYSISGR